MWIHLIILGLLGVTLLLVPFNIRASSLSAPALYQVLMAETALNRQEPGVALAFYLKASEQSDDPGVSERATHLALELSDIQTALGPAQRWAALDTQNIEAQLTTAALFIRMDQSKKALPYLKQVVIVEPEDSEQHFIVLYSELQEEDKPKVVHALESLYRDHKKIAAIPTALADIALQNNAYDQALQWSTKAIKLAPNATNAQIVFAESLRHMEGSEQALAFIEKSIKNSPDNAYLKNYAFQLQLSENHQSAALSTLADLMKIKELPAPLLLQLSQVCIQEKWYDKAMFFLDEAKKFPEVSNEAYYALGRLSELKNHFSDAIGWYQKIEDKSPLQANALMRSALLLSVDKKFEEALNVIQSANPQTADDLKRVTLTESAILIQMKQSPVALSSINRTLRFIPDDPDLLFARGRVYDSMGQYESAHRDLNVVFSQYPNNPSVAVYLGQVLWKMGKTQQARFIWKEALKQSPEDSLLKKTLEEFKVK